MQRLDDPSSLAPLFDAVLATPDAVAPRQVLADALGDRGDERGEFITLQLQLAQGNSSPAARDRESRLRTTHWRRWLSDLPGVQPQGLEFVRGFLVGCTLRPTGRGAQSPTWRTVERLSVVPSGAPPTELASAHLNRLRILTGLDARALEVVLAGPPREALVEVGLAGPLLEDDVRRATSQVLALDRISALRTLVISPRPFRHHAQWLAWLFEAPLARKLTRLVVETELPFDVGGTQSLLAALSLPNLQVEVATEGLRLVFDLRSLSIRFADVTAFGRRAQAIRNLAGSLAPFPYREVEVLIGGRHAGTAQRGELGALSPFIR